MFKQKWSAIVCMVAVMSMQMVLENAISKEIRIVALGDSTTAGTPKFRSPIEYPPNGTGDERHQYVYWIRNLHPDWKIMNAGVNAERIDQIKLRFRKDVLSKKPDILIVMAGVNDVYQGASEELIFERLSDLYQIIRNYNIPFIACSILPYNSAGTEQIQKIHTVNNWIRNHASEWGGQFCDTYQAVEHPLQKGKLISTTDGLHPDIYSHRLLASAIDTCLSLPQ